MKLKVLAAIAACFAVAGCVSGNDPNKHWEKIGPGPTYDYADAQCRIMAQQTQTGIYAQGTAQFVAGAQIGNAIGNAVRMEQFYGNCMTMSGWKKFPNAKPRAG
jgi:hypothetical protein